MKTIAVIMGTRPNFVKAAPIIKQMRKDCPQWKLFTIHTGQHYDDNMSGSFLSALGIGKPDATLVSSLFGPAKRLGYMISCISTLLDKHEVDAVVVFGDVDSTLAGALAASLSSIPLIHVESGLRSFDESMPEERNRIIVDRLSGLLLATEESAVQNLFREEVEGDIRLVGNTMIDSLYGMMNANKSACLCRHGLAFKEYALATFHRKALVESPYRLDGLLDGLAKINQKVPVLLAAHPRLREAIGERDLGGVRLSPAIPYEDFIMIMDGAKFVITDSGGIQEETSVLGVPCLTYRDNTERPVTVKSGTNRLIGMSPDMMVEYALQIDSERYPGSCNIPLWDGKAAERAVRQIREWLE